MGDDPEPGRRAGRARHRRRGGDRPPGSLPTPPSPEPGRRERAGVLGPRRVSSVKTINQPEILEENERRFYLHDDDDPLPFARGSYPFREAARDDWEADAGYQAF